MTTGGKILARQRIPGLVRLAVVVALLGWAVQTPGFLSRLSLYAMLSDISFAGCVAVGMTFITLTGNIMSLALGATVSACSLVFLGSLSLGPEAALAIAMGFGAAITAAQGVVIGALRANAILVSIAALTIIMGVADIATGGQRIYPAGAGFALLRSRVLGVPFDTIALLALALAGQAILSGTRIGREMRMVGSNRRAAEVAGIDAPRAVTMAYALAGCCAAVSGILLAARYGSGDMDLGAGFDYRAIAAVLVGGTAIQGGAGSVLRSLLGMAVLAIIEIVLRLQGFNENLQYLVTGLVVLAVIMLQSLGARR